MKKTWWALKKRGTTEDYICSGADGPFLYKESDKDIMVEEWFDYEGIEDYEPVRVRLEVVDD